MSAMQPGTALAGAQARAAWLAARPAGWTAGWSVWILCALSLVALLAALNERLASPLGASRQASGLGAMAVALASAGAAVDVLCDALWIGVVPELAAQGPDRVFLATERALTVGGTVTANGLYSLAVLVLSALMPASPPWRAARALGALTAAGGVGLCAAGLAGHAGALALFSGLTISAFIVWALALPRAAAAGS